MASIWECSRGSSQDKTSRARALRQLERYPCPTQIRGLLLICSVLPCEHDVRGVTACACASAVSDTRGQRTRRLQLLSPEGDESAATSARPSSNPAAHCTKFSTSCVPCACHPKRTKKNGHLEFLPSEKWGGGGACYGRMRRDKCGGLRQRQTIQFRSGRYPRPTTSPTVYCINTSHSFLRKETNQMIDSRSREFKKHNTRRKKGSAYVCNG